MLSAAGSGGGGGSCGAPLLPAEPSSAWRAPRAPPPRQRQLRVPDDTYKRRFGHHAPLSTKLAPVKHALACVATDVAGRRFPKPVAGALVAYDAYVTHFFYVWGLGAQGVESQDKNRQEWKW